MIIREVWADVDPEPKLTEMKKVWGKKRWGDIHSSFSFPCLWLTIIGQVIWCVQGAPCWGNNNRIRLMSHHYAYMREWFPFFFSLHSSPCQTKCIIIHHRPTSITDCKNWALIAGVCFMERFQSLLSMHWLHDCFTCFCKGLPAN